MIATEKQMQIIALNRKARFNYQICDTWEAGIKLQGLEVKALRIGNISLAESWVKVGENQVKLINCSIMPDKQPQWLKFDDKRERILLLHKSQIKQLKLASQQGLTIIPLRIYFNEKNLVKLEIATAKGKKSYDKRRALQDRDQKRYGLNS